MSSTYHLDPGGDDDAAGTTPARAWRTLRRLSAAELRPGDRVLLRAGARFAGPLTLRVAGGGDAERPVVVGASGPGRATIDAGDGFGVYAQDAGGITLRDLEVVGSGSARNRSSGVMFHTTAGARSTLRGVRVERLEVHGFGRWGLSVGAEGDAGYAGVALRRINAHDNGRGGVLTYGQRRNQHRDVRVEHCAAYANRGEPGLRENSGSGIALGNVDGGVIRRCTTYDNGGANDFEEGGIGIWAYDSRGLLIERNVSYDNRTGGPSDGGGFDLDQNVSDSVLQDNVSHDNDGAGYLIYHGPDTAAHSGNVVRRNVSRLDGRRNGYGGIRVGGRNPGLLVSRNYVEIGRSDHGTPAALQLWTEHSGGYEGVTVRDNRFVARDGARLVDNLAAARIAGRGVRLERNSYEPRGTQELIVWGGRRFLDLGEWRRATGQERRGRR